MCLEPAEEGKSPGHCLEEVTAIWSFEYSENVDKRERPRLNIVLHSVQQTKGIATSPTSYHFQKKVDRTAPFPSDEC